MTISWCGVGPCRRHDDEGDAVVLLRRLFGVVLVLLLRCHPTTALVNPLFGGAMKHPHGGSKPKLVLIGGCPGTGKSTFGMSVALQEGILKCISTDTVRAVMRSFVPADVSPALHRSSYAAAHEQDVHPVRSWKECCTVLHTSVESLVRDAIERRTSLVVEGVHLIPDTEFIDLWQQHGGVAMGCLLQVSDQDHHQQWLQKRGYTTGNIAKEASKISQYERIRAIQDEMMRLADEAGWMRIEQRIEPDPLDMIAGQLENNGGLNDSGSPFNLMGNNDATATPKHQVVFSGQTATAPVAATTATTSSNPDSTSTSSVPDSTTSSSSPETTAATTPRLDLVQPPPLPPEAQPTRNGLLAPQKKSRDAGDFE